MYISQNNLKFCKKGSQWAIGVLSPKYEVSWKPISLIWREIKRVSASHEKKTESKYSIEKFLWGLKHKKNEPQVLKA